MYTHKHVYMHVSVSFVTFQDGCVGKLASPRHLGLGCPHQRKEEGSGPNSSSRSKGQALGP